MKIKTKEEIEAALQEAKDAGRDGRIKEALLQYVLFSFVTGRYIDVMNDMERAKDASSEEDLPMWDQLIEDTVDEYNHFKWEHSSTIIYADYLNGGWAPVVEGLKEGFSELVNYGVQGVGTVLSAVNSIPLVGAATEVCTFCFGVCVESEGSSPYCGCCGNDCCGRGFRLRCRLLGPG